MILDANYYVVQYLVEMADYKHLNPSMTIKIKLDMIIEKGDMQEVLDLLIEGQPRLSVVVILDRSGFDKTFFAAETYNNTLNILLT